MNAEQQRFDLILAKEGCIGMALDWAIRTKWIYKRAVLNKQHFASKPEYRRKYIEAYLNLKTIIKVYL